MRTYTDEVRVAAVVFIYAWTRSTIEVAHSRYLFCERRGSLIPIRRNVNLDFETKYVL